ncbi:hypothetical protein E2C01_004918 [Portunus trituberculatus]|uniref:Uncharacterized protein n=1 Tax=Portunus trituberculatus TaxID=210409 RepID=A0A5B7CRT2_PORTR|nr:hypothetical protein [Portunus trituberculatus]
MDEEDSHCILIGLKRGPPSLNSNRKMCTRWSKATLPPKLNFTKLRFAKCKGLDFPL